MPTLPQKLPKASNSKQYCDSLNSSSAFSVALWGSCYVLTYYIFLYISYILSRFQGPLGCVLLLSKHFSQYRVKRLSHNRHWGKKKKPCKSIVIKVL